MIFINFHTPKNCSLFVGIEEENVKAMLNCLGARQREYRRDEFVLRAESRAEYVGIVVSGAVNVIQEDFWGNRSILSHISHGGLFGEAFSCAQTERLPVSVIATEKTEILRVDCGKIFTQCASACAFHSRLIMNMTRTLAEKNIMLTHKIEHLSKKTTRGKLLSFLSSYARENAEGTIVLPFNRQELADYLCVDRSALSRELSLMREEGLINYDRNRFELLKSGYQT